VWQRDFMSERNAAALAEMQERFGVEVTGLDSAALREGSRQIQDRVARDLGLQELLDKVRAAAR
ncbi:MAG TPA: hypothetical protein VGD06_02005, partial [Acidobacteriota bacterium]